MMLAKPSVRYRRVNTDRRGRVLARLLGCCCVHAAVRFVSGHCQRQRTQGVSGPGGPGNAWRARQQQPKLPAWLSTCLLPPAWPGHAPQLCRKTVNAYNHKGARVAVNAQQYAVLVTNVNQPCYPEFVASR